MTFTLWYLIIGGLLILWRWRVRSAPPAADNRPAYLAVGFGLGPAGLGLVTPDPIAHAAFLERITEIAVIVSLFTAGLKLRVPLSDRQWLLPVRLAFVSMAVTVGLIALIGVTLLEMSPGAAILLGAILAPTDPVLASDVQVENPWDRDHLRFSLTGEAGLNDGTAFPFMMLGLGLLGHTTSAPTVGAGSWWMCRGRSLAGSGSADCSARWSGMSCCTSAVNIRKRPGWTISWRSG